MLESGSELSSKGFSVTGGKQLIPVAYDFVGMTFFSHDSVHSKVV